MIEIAALMAALAVSPYEHCITRDQRGRIARSAKARADFAKLKPCPLTAQPQTHCPGWRIDHIVPLKRCGPDTPENMQWLTIDEWRKKTRWE